MLFLNKKLREGGSRGCNIALVGKPGVGKCLHPDTPVRLFDLSVKRAADVKTGDQLMGDDGTPREVLSTVTGEEKMYTIHQEYGESYTVNESHILSLWNRSTNQVEDVPLVEFVQGRLSVEQYSPYFSKDEREGSNHAIPTWKAMHLGRQFAAQLRQGSVMDMPDNAWDWPIRVKTTFVEGVWLGTDHASLPVWSMSPEMQNWVEFLRRAGLRCRWSVDEHRLLLRRPDLVYETWSIEAKGEGAYAGFMIDGNRRFLLGDWTVTHNTAIAKCLSECLQIPFAQLSFGGVTNAEFLMGHDYTYIGSRPGEITRCMTRLGVKNGILFFDEFDKVTDKKEIMSTLLHLTDFSQNNEFRDNYFPELTQDLSKVWFIYSMNHLPTDPAMLDRLEVIHVDEYSIEERIHISEKYLFPKYLNELKLTDRLKMEPAGIRKLVDVASGGNDKQGVRELERMINLVVEKVFFYLSNVDQAYTYPWFVQTQKCDRDGVVHLTESLIEAILKDKQDERHSRLSFLNMYV